MFWNRPHKHYWVILRTNVVSSAEVGKAIAEVITYRCWGCGSIRYDKVNGDGLVSVKITDDKGKIVEI